MTTSHYTRKENLEAPNREGMDDFYHYARDFNAPLKIGNLRLKPMALGVVLLFGISLIGMYGYLTREGLKRYFSLALSASSSLKYFRSNDKFKLSCFQHFTELRHKVGPRLRELAPAAAARGGQEARSRNLGISVY